MIEHPDIHHFGCLTEGLGQTVIVRAGTGVSRRMIVTKHQCRGPFQKGFPQNAADIYLRGSQSALTDTQGIYQTGGLIEQHHPAFFDRKIAHQGMKIKENVL